MSYSSRVNLVGAAITILSLGVAPIAIAQDISTSDIVALIAEMEYHTNQGNVEALVNVIDPEASFAIASEIGIEPALVRIANLETFFAKGFEGVESHRVNLAIDDIEIEGSVATVTGTTVDRSVQDGLETISHLSWTNVIERQEDDLKVIQWRSRMTGYSIREVESSGDL
ncbi:MAG: hypothetical protein AAF974_07215 [Cyanobacteria bacterium P01_E01_bin.34]